MASSAAKDLLSYSAWPTDTLHTSPGGAVTGFLMERVREKQPIHMLYSPAHRKQDYPKAAWDFLLVAARNTAAAFETIHRHGHVLGDVNQGNVMVGADARVLLIDSDSMQINAAGRLHLCEVGVSHFTPPELQGISSFATVARTANHDAFGLALLIFHLLFGGRHPFAGRPLRDEVGNGLEPDIKAFRFAYGFDAAQRGFAPPPNSIAFSLVPSSTQVMFHRAFTEVGAQANGRPKASEWLVELDKIRAGLKTCGRSRMHVYPNHSPECPWCKLDSAGAYFFIDLVHVAAGQGSTFVLARVWAAIESIQPPRMPTPPAPGDYASTAAPLPEGVRKKPNRAGSLVIALIAIGVLSVMFPKIAVLWIIGGLITWWTASGGNGKSFIEEKDRRTSAHAQADRAYQQLLGQLRDATKLDRFQEAKQSLEAARQTHAGFAAKEAKLLLSVQEKARERQLTEYLEKFFLDSASIPGLGPAKKAALRSFGIETAADLSTRSVSAVKGFGPKLTATMMRWQADKVRGFRFNSSPQALHVETAKVRQEVAAQRQKVESVLQGGPEHLTRIKSDVESSVAKLMPQLQRAAQALSQASANLIA